MATLARRAPPLLLPRLLNAFFALLPAAGPVREAADEDAVPGETGTGD